MQPTYILTPFVASIAVLLLSQPLSLFIEPQIDFRTMPAVMAIAQQGGVSRVRVRKVNQLPRDVPASAVVQPAGSDGIATIDIRDVSIDVLSAALKSVSQLSSAKSRYPTANLMIEIPKTARVGKLTSAEKLRLEAIVSQLKATSVGGIVEIINPRAGHF